jgi:hypothetical protein
VYRPATADQPAESRDIIWKAAPSMLDGDAHQLGSVRSIWLQGYSFGGEGRLADRALPGFPNFATGQRQWVRELSLTT